MLELKCDTFYNVDIHAFTFLLLQSFKCIYLVQAWLPMFMHKLPDNCEEYRAHFQWTILTGLPTSRIL